MSKKPIKFNQNNTPESDVSDTDFNKQLNQYDHILDLFDSEEDQDDSMNHPENKLKTRTLSWKPTLVVFKMS